MSRVPSLGQPQLRETGRVLGRRPVQLQRQHHLLLHRLRSEMRHAAPVDTIIVLM